MHFSALIINPTLSREILAEMELMVEPAIQERRALRVMSVPWDLEDCL